MLKHLIFSLIALLIFGVFVQTFAQAPTAKDYFDQGLRLVKERKLAEALTAFQKSAQLEPRQSSTHGNIGMTLLALSRPAEAVAPFREAVRLMPANGRFRAGLCQSLSLIKSHDEAVKQCEESVGLDENAPEARGELITAYRAAKRSDEALRAANAALQKFPENEMLLNLAAEANAEIGNFTRTTEIYEILARLKPDSVFYLVKLADNYLRFERDSDAIASANKALQIEKNPLAYFFLGKVYFEVGQNEEAAKAFQEAAALDSKYSDAFYFLGLSEKRLGKFENAIKALRQAVALEPENTKYLDQLGSALNSDSQYEEAVPVFRKAAALKPDDFIIKTGLGLALFESAQFDEALTILSEADRMKPGNEIVNMFLRVARSRQQGSAQIEDLKRFAKEKPKDVKIRVQLIQLLGFGRRLSEAEPYVEEVLKIKPKDSLIYIHIATVFSTAGKSDKAFEMYQRALEIEQNPGAYLGLSSYYTKRGQIENALKAFAKVLELKPDSPNIMINYADLLRQNGKRREALEIYKRSLAILPTNPASLFNAAILSAKLGDFDSADKYLETLKSVDRQTAKMLARSLKLLR